MFLKMAKEGSTVSGLMDSFATSVSVALQYGVPLRDLVNKFAHVRFEPSGFTGNQEIPIAKSIVDYIFRWLASRFLTSDDKSALGLIDRSAMAESPLGGGFGGGAASFGSSAAPASPAGGASPSVPEPTPANQPETDTPKASAVAVETAEPPTTIETPAPTSEANAPVAAASSTRGASSPARDELAVVATNGHANGHTAKSGNGNGGGTVTLSLGTTNVAFKIQEDAPSCAECGSIMVRNGSCYKCLNCGSTSGCS
jgi:ribonucleoside-diphosphate reductase alpha chain